MALQSAQLNGTNQSFSKDLDLVTGWTGYEADDLTVTASIKTSSNARQDIISVGDGSGSGNNGKHFDFFVHTDGSLGVFLDDSVNTYFYNPSVIQVDDGDWHGVSFTYNVTTRAIKIYVDGVQDGSTGTVPSNIDDLWSLSSTTGQLVVGARKGSGGLIGNFNGNIAYARMFNKELSLTEVNTEHASVDAVDANNYFDLRLNGDATDSSTNGNDLTNNNSATFAKDNPLTDISLYGDTKYTNYIEATTQNAQVDDNLTGYPYYFDLADIPSASNFWSTVSSDGSDIRVFDSTGTTQYPLEVVSIDTVAQTGEIHFKADTNSTTDITFRLYFNGTSSARDTDALYGRNEVWKNIYAGVWHGSGTVNAVNGNAIIQNGSITIGGATGKIGLATTFDGSDDYLQFATQFGAGQYPFTVSSWVKPTTGADTSTGRSIVSFNDTSSGGNQHALIMSNLGGGAAGDDFSAMSRSSSGAFASATSSALSMNSWAYVVAKYISASNRKASVDSSNEVTNTTSDTITSQDTVDIGRLGDSSPNWHWLGDIQEVRVTESELSSTWISTEYNNQNSPSTFWSVDSVAPDTARNNFLGFSRL